MEYILKVCFAVYSCQNDRAKHLLKLCAFPSFAIVLLWAKAKVWEYFVVVIFEIFVWFADHPSISSRRPGIWLDDGRERGAEGQSACHLHWTFIEILLICVTLVSMVISRKVVVVYTIHSNQWGFHERMAVKLLKCTTVKVVCTLTLRHMYCMPHCKTLTLFQNLR